MCTGKTRYKTDIKVCVQTSFYNGSKISYVAVLLICQLNNYLKKYYY